MDKDAHHIRAVFENKVCTASDKYTGLFLCQFFDHFCLIIKEIVCGDKSAMIRLDQPAFVDSCGISKERIIAKFFICLIEQLFFDSAVIGCHTQNFSVITVYTQIFCQHLTDGFSTASILSCDRNDQFSHSTNPLLFSKVCFLDRLII